MTFQDQIAADVFDVFLPTDASGFAEDITYTPSGSSARTIRAIVVRGNRDYVDGSDGLLLREVVQVHISTDADDGVASVSEDDTAVIDGLTYKVRGEAMRDGHGMQRVELVRVRQYEKSGDRYRVSR